MERFVADTHAIVWYLEARPTLGHAAKAAFDLMHTGQALIYVSVMSLMEMDYLIHKGKITALVPKLIEETCALSPKSALQLHAIDKTVYDAFLRVPAAAIPELPDRVITATALARKCPVITKDHVIAAWRGVKTVWE